jgi:ankyrin repeat protein
LELGVDADHTELRRQVEKFPDHHDLNAPIHRSGLTALKHAILVGNDTYVRTLIELGAAADATLFGGKAVHFNAGACGKRGSVPILHALVEHGADLSAQTSEGYQTVHKAARGWKKYCFEYMSALLQLKGVNVNAVRVGGNATSPLHEAAFRSTLEMVKILVYSGADINARDADGETALHKAARSDNTHVVWGLMELGADVSVKNKRGLDVQALAKALHASYDTTRVIEERIKKLQNLNDAQGLEKAKPKTTRAKTKKTEL